LGKKSGETGVKVPVKVSSLITSINPIAGTKKIDAVARKEESKWRAFSTRTGVPTRTWKNKEKLWGGEFRLQGARGLWSGGGLDKRSSKKIDNQQDSPWEEGEPAKILKTSSVGGREKGN